MDNDITTFVQARLEKDEEKAPFCPFNGREKVGYCSLAYSSACYVCTESRDEWEKQIARIKACPWCGETDKRAIIRRGLDGRYFIHHMDAVFNIKSSCGFDTEAEAVAAWEKMRAKDGETEKLH